METDHVTLCSLCRPGCFDKEWGQVAPGINRRVWADDENKMFLVLIYAPPPLPKKNLSTILDSIS